MSLLSDPLDFRLDGRPFWGFSGAEGDDDGDNGDADGDDNDGDSNDPMDRLKGTLAKVSAERKAARDEYRPWKATLRELGIESPEDLREKLSGKGKQQDQQVDVEKIRADAERDADLKASRRVALADVKAAAKGKFADPDDAVNYLKGSVDDLLGRDGQPDAREIEHSLDELLRAKPHWGVKDKNLDFDGGARNSGGGKPTMDNWIREKSRSRRG